jgi:hypothetical protein
MRILWLGILVILSCKSASDTGAQTGDEGRPAAAMSSQQSLVPLSTDEGRAQAPVRLPGVMSPATWLADATRVVAYGGRDDAVIVAAGIGWLRWFSKEGTLLGEYLGEGGTQVLELVDVKGDGNTAIAWGRGRARGALEAPAKLELVRWTGTKAVVESIPLPPTARAQVVAASQIPGAAGELWVASFVNKFEVEVNRFQRSARGEWSLAESRGRHRVVGDMSVLPDGTPVIARMYGDTADAPGGVYQLAGAGAALQIPSTRGARAVVAMPGPEPSVAMADGWHKNYGKEARGLVSVARLEGASWQPAGRVEVEKVYGFSRLRLGDVHKEPGLELIASGNGAVVVVLPTRTDLLFNLPDRVALDAYPIDLSGDLRMEVVILGPEPAIWSAL